MEAVSTSETSVNLHEIIWRQDLRRQSFSYSPLWETEISLSKPLWWGYSMLRSEIRSPSTQRPDYGGNKHLWNVGKLLQGYTVQHSRTHLQNIHTFSCHQIHHWYTEYQPYFTFSATQFAWLWTFQYSTCVLSRGEVTFWDSLWENHNAQPTTLRPTRDEQWHDPNHFA
jgi:hypothetical protein